MTAILQPRRVSFDLNFNTIHVLPTLEETSEQAKRLKTEAKRNRCLSRELPSDSIIEEIMHDCDAHSRITEIPVVVIPLKSCLKPPPAPRVRDAVTDRQKRKTSKSKKNKHKKSKRAPTKRSSEHQQPYANAVH